MANGAKLLLAVLYGTTGDNVQKLHLGRFRLGIKEKKKKSRKITSKVALPQNQSLEKSQKSQEDPLTMRIHC